MKLLLSIVLVVLVSCNVHGGSRDMMRAARLKQLATATSKFSLDLYNKFSTKNKNLIISPFSVFTALAMVSLGSKGQTMDEIYNTLNIQSVGADIHQAFEYYTSLLQGLTNVTLNNANGMFVKPGTQLLPEFAHRMNQYYHAKVQEFDFSNPNGPEAPINDWVSNQTAGMIKDFLKPGSIDGNTIMWLINAIYFKGTWKNVFDERLTRKQKFHVSKTTQVDVDMMTLSEKMFRYKRLDNLKTTVMELPYVGDRYSMYILLPDDIEGLSTLESSLDATSLESALTNLDKRDFFTLGLPKIKVDNKLQLKSAIQELGAQKLFDPTSADLSKMTGRTDIYVGAAIQQAVIEINERGTEAAAVTGFGIHAMVMIKSQYLTVDKPFMFVLRDTTAGVNLFHDLDKRDFFTLGLPKIKVENKLQLKSAIQELGAQKLFDSASADLSKMTGRTDIYVGEAIQQAVIEINERGTKAAAVTGFGFVATSIIMSQHLTINKPFMFVLRDTTAGVNLFHGRYSDPRE